MNKNKIKCKLYKAFESDFDYIYRIITIAIEWYFVLFTSDGISSTSKDLSPSISDFLSLLEGRFGERKGVA